MVIRSVLGASTALVLGTLSAQAGGIERTAFNPAFLFEKGNYFELSFGSVSPKVSGTAFTVDSGDMASSYTNLSGAVKYQITDEFALGIVVDQPVGVNVAYPEGTGYFFSGADAEVTALQLSVLGHYRLSENVSVYGGLRAEKARGEANDVTIDLNPDPATFAPFSYDMQTSSEVDYGYVVGVAYERPEIALRVALSYISAITHDFAATDNIPFPGTVDFSTTVPQGVNLDFQTGVAANTLVFGSIRWRDWSEFSIIPRGVVELSSDNKDTTSYTLGVGRKFSDSFSALASIGYEPAAGDEVGNLGPTDGYKTLTLAGIYTAPTGMKITVGASYGKLGDATTSGIGGEFSGSSVVGVGVKVGYSF